MTCVASRESVEIPTTTGTGIDLDREARIGQAVGVAVVAQQAAEAPEEASWMQIGIWHLGGQVYEIATIGYLGVAQSVEGPQLVVGQEGASSTRIAIHLSVETASMTATTSRHDVVPTGAVLMTIGPAIPSLITTKEHEVAPLAEALAEVPLAPSGPVLATTLVEDPLDPQEVRGSTADVVALLEAHREKPSGNKGTGKSLSLAPEVTMIKADFVSKEFLLHCFMTWVAGI